MGFETADIELKQTRSATQATLSCLTPTWKGKKKNGAKPCLTITLPTTLFRSKKEFFILQIGSGEHRGFLRIIAQNAANKATVKPKDLKHSVIFRFGHVPKLGEYTIFDKVNAEIIVSSEDCYDLRLPSTDFLDDAREANK
jgi:hypothetical protein